MREPSIRLNDYYEVYEIPDPAEARSEADRCMNCGAAFCMPEGGYTANHDEPAGCPISNRIPDWNALVEQNRWRDAYDQLASTNNFPEFTSRVCPAPCQDSCIVGINERPIAIKGIERAIIDMAFERGWVMPRVPKHRTGKTVAIVGSGPAGLAAADELNARGHTVTVYERSDYPGGLLRYGIPSMKLDKDALDRRIGLMLDAGIHFICNAEVGNHIDPLELRDKNDALILTTGALQPRDLMLPGRHLRGIVQAMPYLEHAARHQAVDLTDRSDPLHAGGKKVIVIGGGDTGTDCIATALRQGAQSIVSLTRRQQPPENRDHQHPWPGAGGAFSFDYAHSENLAHHGVDPRLFSIQPIAFLPDASGMELVGVEYERLDRPASEHGHISADMAILAVGFVGGDSDGCFRRLGLPISDDHNGSHQKTAMDKVWLAGDARRGASLVVHAIAEGRRVANAVHRALTARN